MLTKKMKMLDSAELVRELENVCDGENVVISPTGMSLIISVLNESNSYDTTLNAWNNLAYSQTSPSGKKKIEVDSNTALWHLKEASLAKNFKKWLTEKPEISVQSKSPIKLDEINSWVYKASRKLIKKLDIPIYEDTLWVLVNVLYFKGDWKDAFSYKKNSLEFFNIDKDRKKKVVYMNMGSQSKPKSLEYFEHELYESVKLPYAKKGLVQEIYLPKPDVVIDDVIKLLGLKEREANSKLYQSEKVILKMPKYTVESTVDLVGLFRKKNLIDFEKEYFEGYLRQYISDIKQSTVLKVSEHGTEAASATYLRGKKGPSLPREKSIHFFMNRPFFFVIKDEISGLDLFAGLIKVPENEGSSAPNILLKTPNIFQSVLRWLGLKG